MRGFVTKRIIKPFITSLGGIVIVYIVIAAVIDLKLGTIFTIFFSVIGSVFIYGLLLLIIYREKIGILKHSLRNNQY